MPLEPLLALLQDHDEPVRRAAAEALKKSGKQVSIDALLLLLYEKDASIRQVAIEVLETQPERIPLEPFVELLADENGDVRDAAMQVLKKVAPQVVHDLVPQAMSILRGELVGNMFISLNQMFVADTISNLVLSSLNAVTKESAIATMILGRASPDPGFGSQIELRGRDAGGLLDLLGVGKALPGERIAAEEAPPALLQVQPARSGGNEDLMDARVIDQPGAGLEAVVTREIVSDDEDIPARIVGFDVGEQGDVALGVARGGTAGQLLAITYPQCPVDPGFLGSALIVKWRFDAVSSGGPAWGGGKGARHYWSEFVGTDGRRPLRWLRVVGDDRRPFGTKSLSRGVAQLWVCRHRTPSRRRMRRI